MTSALIGSTGFVGRTLLFQRYFDRCYHSTDIVDIDGHEFDLVICAAAPGRKWYANLHPEEDKKSIQNLIHHLESVRAEQFILISTVDVFPLPFGVDEDTGIDLEKLSPYGYHRRQLEVFVKKHFHNRLIARLPGLVGHGLKKNVLYDFKHHNELEKIESDSIFQFYPMKFLWRDLQIALAYGLNLIHLTAAPLTVNKIARNSFHMDFVNHPGNTVVYYDFMTKYANLWGKDRHYQYDESETLDAIRQYAEE